jgi:uncharacterized protein YndB with AHSA1/START domain
MKQSLRLPITLPVAESAVYQAITDSSSLEKWLTERARVSLSEGIFELWGRYLPGAPERPVTTFVEATENRLLRFTWNYKSEVLPVTIELASSNKGTVLALTQEVLEAAIRRS